MQFFKSSVGQKYLMGFTGLIWMGFVFTHMAANMLILISADLYNSYAHALVSNKLILYPAEGLLILALVAHVITAIRLTRQNNAARSVQYGGTPKGSSWASRYMAVQGSAILAFIILHLITFKYGAHYETTVSGVVMRDLHRLVLEVFQNPAYVGWYVVCLLLLLFHLSHGASSIFQSFGILERKMQSNIKKLAWVYALVVVGGFLSQPAYVFFFHR